MPALKFLVSGNENDCQISKLLEDKNKLDQQYLNASDKDCKSLHQ